MKILYSLMMCILCASVACAAPRIPKVAVMYAQNGMHNSEFNFAFNNLGWTVDGYHYSTEEHARLSGKLSEYDFVITVPLFNWDRDPDNASFVLPSDEVKESFRNYINNGGIFVMTDAAYETSYNWISKLGEEFENVKVAGCNSSIWGVKGFTYNSDPPHPIRYFPNNLVEPNSWPHLLHPESDSKWNPIAYCSEGFPVVLAQQFGRGYVVLASIRQPYAESMENYYANALLVRSGINLKNFEMSPIKLGKGSIKMELKEPAKQKAALVFEIIDENNKVERFGAEVKGSSCKFDFNVTKRGPLVCSLILSMGKDNETVLFTRNQTIPPLLVVRPNSYRGFLSTKRRLPSVNFYADIVPFTENLTNSKLVLSVIDGKGNKVATGEQKVTVVNLPSEVVIPVTMKKELPAGEYVVSVELVKSGAPFNGTKAETKIKILEPNHLQAIVDEDNTFLTNGVPFFPVGVFHANPTMFERLEEVGFNALQFWQWDAVPRDENGEFFNVKKANEHGLRLLVTMNHIWKDKIIEECNSWGRYPAMFMWYVMDEPSPGGSYADADLFNRTFHENDEDHPTFLASCRPDLFREQSQYADVFASDPYAVPTVVADFTEKAVLAVDNRKPVIMALGSFDENCKELYQPPKMMRAGAYAALVHDVRGIYWYPWMEIGGTGGGAGKSEEIQKTLAQICSDLKIMTPALTSLKRRPFKMNDSVHAMVCGVDTDQRFLMMVNLKDESIDVNYTVDELVKVDKVRNPFTENKAKNIEIKKGVISKTFEPYEVLIYNW